MKVVVRGESWDAALDPGPVRHHGPWTRNSPRAAAVARPAAGATAPGAMRVFLPRPRTSHWTCCARPGAGLQILGGSMTWESGCHDAPAPAPAVRSAVGARSEHVDSRRTAARRHRRYGPDVGGAAGEDREAVCDRSLRYPETNSTRYCPRFSTHFYHPITTIPASERSEKTSRGCARGRQGSRVAYMRRQSRH